MMVFVPVWMIALIIHTADISRTALFPHSSEILGCSKMAGVTFKNRLIHLFISGRKNFRDNYQIN